MAARNNISVPEPGLARNNSAAPNNLTFTKAALDDLKQKLIPEERAQEINNRCFSNYSAPGSTHLPYLVAVHILYEFSDLKQSSKRTLILSTGGTFGSFLTETGKLSPSPRKLESLLKNIIPPSFNWKFLELPKPIDSTEADIGHWNLVSFIIYSLCVDKKLFTSVVVIHGTDTLADFSSGISFAFWNISFPIIVTGSQMPLCIESRETDAVDHNSDAKQNILFACSVCKQMSYEKENVSDEKEKVSEQKRFKLYGVFVAFAGKLMLGTRVTKIHTSGEDAFESPNKWSVVRQLSSRSSECSFFVGGAWPETAIEVSFGSENGKKKKEWWAVRESYLNSLSDKLSARLDEQRHPEIYLFDPTLQVEVIPLAPGMYLQSKWHLKTEEEKKKFVVTRWAETNAIIVEAYGCGNIPNHVKEMLEIAASENGVKVAIVSKCVKGSTAPGKYEVGADHDIADMKDATTHAAYAKALAEISRKRDITQEQFKKCICRVTRGEFHSVPVSPLNSNPRVTAADVSTERFHLQRDHSVSLQ